MGAFQVALSIILAGLVSSISALSTERHSLHPEEAGLQTQQQLLQQQQQPRNHHPDRHQEAAALHLQGDGSEIPTRPGKSLSSQLQDGDEEGAEEEEEEEEEKARTLDDPESRQQMRQQQRLYHDHHHHHLKGIGHLSGLGEQDSDKPDGGAAEPLKHRLMRSEAPAVPFASATATSATAAAAVRKSNRTHALAAHSELKAHCDRKSEATGLMGQQQQQHHHHYQHHDDGATTLESFEGDTATATAVVEAEADDDADHAGGGRGGGGGGERWWFASQGGDDDDEEEQEPGEAAAEAAEDAAAATASMLKNAVASAEDSSHGSHLQGDAHEALIEEDMDTEDDLDASSLTISMMQDKDEEFGKDGSTSTGESGLLNVGRWMWCDAKYGRPVYHVHAGLCMLSGCIKGNVHYCGYELTRVPSQCQPTKGSIFRVQAVSGSSKSAVVTVSAAGVVSLLKNTFWDGHLNLASIILPAKSSYQPDFASYRTLYRRRRTYQDFFHVQYPKVNDPTVLGMSLSFFSPRYSITKGICSLAGFIVSVVRLNLPDSCLPLDVSWFLQATTDRSFRKSVYILPAPVGQLRPHPDDGGGHVVSLSGIVYPTNADRTTNIDLQGTWGPFGEYAHPTCYLQDSTCLLTGLISGFGVAGTTAAELPFFCRPRYKVEFTTTDTEFAVTVTIRPSGKLTVSSDMASLTGIAFKAMELNMAGKQGIPGLPGVDGPKGDPGPWGAPGRTGKVGPPGHIGKLGLTGPTGDPGPPGDYGPSGTTVSTTRVVAAPAALVSVNAKSAAQGHYVESRWITMLVTAALSIATL